MDYENEIKSIEWMHLANRKESLIHASVTSESYPFSEKTTGIDWNSAVLRNLRTGKLLYDSKKMGELRELFFKEGIEILNDFKERMIYYVETFDRMARLIAKTDCSKLSKNCLVGLLEDYFKAALHAHTFLAPMVVADRVLSKMIVDNLPDADEKQKQEWLGILAYPSKENEHSKEERSFYNLAKARLNGDKNFDNLVEEHLNNFSWIGARGYWFNSAWQKEHIAERLNNFFSQGKTPEDELLKLNKAKEDSANTKNELIKRFNIQENLQLYKPIQMAQEYAYLRTWRSDLIYGAGYRARHLFYEAAKRAGLNADDVLYLTWSELIEMAKTGKPPVSEEKISQRKGDALFFCNKNNISVIIPSEEWKGKLDSLFSEDAPEISEIRGRIAFAGKAKGRVSLVDTDKDLSKVKFGDIMVAAMTFPNFIPAMEKAGAFVTDEGGILCHAAIIAREMQKPCIVGTKIATAVLKNGDLVEVDADEGVVRKIGGDGQK
jgi:phosphohistidine swiveling domain-containing protein